MSIENMMPEQISILGVDYDFGFGKLKDDRDGEINRYTKEITIRPLNEFEGDGAQEQTYLQNHTIRHEIVHAYLDESGLRAYSDDETLVDWIATMIERMYETMAEVRAV